MSSKFRRKVVIVLTMDIRGICFHEIFAENETFDTVRYLAFLKRFMDH